MYVNALKALEPKNQFIFPFLFQKHFQSSNASNPPDASCQLGRTFYLGTT